MGWFSELVVVDYRSEFNFYIWSGPCAFVYSVCQVQNKAREDGRSLEGINMSDQEVMKWRHQSYATPWQPASCLLMTPSESFSPTSQSHGLVTLFRLYHVIWESASSVPVILWTSLRTSLWEAGMWDFSYTSAGLMMQPVIPRKEVPKAFWDKGLRSIFLLCSSNSKMLYHSFFFWKKCIYFQPSQGGFRTA